MDVPSSWLVRPQEALYDLDNIQLGRLSSEDTTIDAVFGLDYLVIEGHARDSVSNAPPRGVQLELIDGDDNAIDDTLVVANLGYVQFKAKPGVFQLQIRKGRGRDIFEMESVGNEGWDSPTVKAVGSEITLTSFEGLTLYPRLRRKEGMEDVDVLADTDEEDAPGMFGGLASKVMSIFSPKEGTKDVASTIPQADINIFTVASGLLYEVSVPPLVDATFIPNKHPEICIYHDSQRPAQHQEHRQILVYRKLPFAVFPGMLIFSSRRFCLTVRQGIYPPLR